MYIVPNCNKKYQYNNNHIKYNKNIRDNLTIIFTLVKLSYIKVSSK